MPDTRLAEDPRLGRLAEEQAALRRVATLVAQGIGPEELFSAVSDEVGRLFGAEAVIARFEADGSAMVVVGLTAGIPVVTVGTRWTLEPFLASTAVYRTGRPARNDHTGHRDASGRVADSLRQMDFVSTVSVPITVNGRVWGVMTVSDKSQPLAPDTEERVEAFTELVATAIANADSRWALGQLAEEQAALRRVATLVARAPASEDVFSAVAREVASVLDVSGVIVTRYDADGTALTLGEAFRPGLAGAERFLGVGIRMPPDPGSLAAQVHDTHGTARIDDFSTLPGTVGELARAARLGSGCASPIMVNGALWGKMCVFSRLGEVLPAGTENRLSDFIELTATAIANYESRADLAASEARARELAEEQAALRRVATLVARGVRQEDLFSAVSREVGDLFGAEAAVARFEADGPSIVNVGITPGIPFSVGSPIHLEDFLASTKVYRTGRAARSDYTEYLSASGPTAEQIRQTEGFHSTVGAPIVVEGNLWGVILVAHATALPSETEERVERFSELVATAIANAESRSELAASEGRANDLAREQAALRRVATLVAGGARPSEVFSAVCEEVTRLFGSDQVTVGRYEPDGSGVVFVGSYGPDRVPIGSRWPLEDFLAVTAVYRTGHPAAIYRSDYETASGPVADRLREMNVGSRLGVPIVVEGKLWGVVSVNYRTDHLPPDAEQRVAKFTELVATAIANAESRRALAASEAQAHNLAKEQAALRRVATLVATEATPDEVFSAVAREVSDVLEIPGVTICRSESDGFRVIRSRGMPGFPAGSHWPWDVPSLPRLISESGRPARIDDFTDAAGLNAAARDAGVKAAVGVPIAVAGTVWGSICVTTTRDDPLPANTEERVGRFRDLLATSISNAIIRDELAASRARVIAAADDARRRIERDLHDGAQQRLVTLMAELRTIEATMPGGADALRADVSRVADGLAAAVHELRELSRGIHPAVLTEGGLSPALKALKRRAAVRVTLDVQLEHRLSDQVETAAYYTVSEALTNASRHANARRVWISLTVKEGVLHLSIRDDGVGGADPSRGSGLTGLRDRIEALGGKIQIVSPPGGGTSIDVQIPILEPRVAPQDRSYERPSPTRAPGASSGVRAKVGSHRRSST